MFQGVHLQKCGEVLRYFRVISEATQQFISGIAPRVMLDDVFYNTIPSTHIKVFFESSLH